MLHEPTRKRGAGQQHGGGTDRQAVSLLVPFIRLLDEKSRLGVNQPYPQRELPSIAERTHSTGEILLNELQPVLLEPAHPRLRDSTPYAEGLADQRCESLDDASAHQGRQYDVRIAQESPRGDYGDVLVVPVRHLEGLGDEVLERLRGVHREVVRFLQRLGQQRVDQLRWKQGEIR